MIYFTSDQHFWHSNVIKYCNRPYQDVEEMNEALIAKWNSIVKPEDTVYCLGDFSMAFRPVEVITPRLMGKKLLIPGNHDWCHDYNKKGRSPENNAKWRQKYTENGWEIIPQQTTIDLGDNIVVNACHHPYKFVETYDDKYAKWRPTNDGKWLLCGHVHEKWKIWDKQINVGVDVWNFEPVSVNEIKKIIIADS